MRNKAKYAYPYGRSEGRVYWPRVGEVWYNTASRIKVVVQGSSPYSVEYAVLEFGEYPRFGWVTREEFREFFVKRNN